MTFSMKELERVISLENTPVHSSLPNINSLLHNAVLTCMVAMSLEKSSKVRSQVKNSSKVKEKKEKKRTQ